MFVANSSQITRLDYFKVFKVVIEGFLFHLHMHVPDCSFHVGYKWVMANVSMTRGMF
jgi:hypothetical protein